MAYLADQMSIQVQMNEKKGGTALVPTVYYPDGQPTKTYKMGFHEAVNWASHLWSDGYPVGTDDAKLFYVRGCL